VLGKWYIPSARATSIPTESMDAARKAATAILRGSAGMIAAVMRMTGPIQVIIGAPFVLVVDTAPQWIITPRSMAVSTR